MSIIGQEIENYTVNQINARQKLHGSGTSSARTPQQISVLNSNTSWVKLASGVKIDKSKLTELGLPTSLEGMELAKNNVLFGGTSKLVNGEKLQQKEGFLPYQSNSSYTYGDFGYTPMPGITSADIKALTRGSLKKATVKFKVHNKQQFDIVDVLYMRLGYTVLLEWGNSMYTSNGTDRQLVQQTIIEDSVRFFSSGYEKGKSYRDMLPVIEFYRSKYQGNYDGLLGKVSNFNWSFQSDGSYDIEITIISLGDVVESLKTNISSNKQLSAFIENTLAANTSGSGEEGNNLVEENADSNDIAAMLYCWKYVNKDKLAYESYEDSIYIKRPDDTGDRFVGAFLETSTSITTTSVTYRFAYLAYGYDTEIYPDFSSDPYYKPVEISYDISNFPNHEEEAIKEAKAKSDKLRTDGKTPLSFVNPDGDKDYKRVLAGYESLGSKKTTIDSPLTNFNKKDACFINTEPDKQFYLRFGALLTYLKNNIIPKVNTSNSNYNNKPPIFNINTDVYGNGNLGNYMYSLPNQISLDPRVCIVRNDKFQTTSGITEVYKHLSPFRAEDYAENPNPNKAYIMNIYLNFNFIIECINNNLDEKGDIGVFGFLKAICDGLNKSLGGINNLEPIIKEESNTLYIIDTTPIPGIGSQTVPYTLQLFGYNASTSNFVRNVDLKTAITPEYATMITVGATAGGYVKGTEATAFSKWNNGLKDRFQEEFIPGNENSAKEGDEDEAASNYTNKFLSAKAGSASRYGFKGNLVSDDAKNLQIDPGAIEKNISVVTEYYKYLIASQKNQQGGTIGFIPFKLNFSMDGISGIKIYNKLHVDTRFLPKAYGNELDLIVTGVSHKLSNDDWETDIETTLIPKTNELKDLVITAEAIVEDINNNPPTNASEGAISGALSSGTQKDKIIKFMNTLINSGGLTKLQAAGVAGNVLAESSFEEWNVENGKVSSRGSGIGLMQWTGGFNSNTISGRKRFEIFVGKWLTDNGVTSKWIKNKVLDTDPKNHDNGNSLENDLKTIPKLFEAQVAFSVEFVKTIKPFVMKNFNGKLSGNTFSLVTNGFFKYAENGKVKQDLGGYTEIFLVDGEVSDKVLKALRGEGKETYRKEVDKRVELAKKCLEIFESR
jgi:hypothetical protein